MEKDKKEMEKKKMFILDDKKKEKTGQTNQKVTSAKGSPELEGQKRPVWEERADLRCEELEGKYSRQWKEK